MIKNYFKENKQIIILMLTMTLIYLILNSNHAHCEGEPVVLNKITTGLNNYFEKMTFEKFMGDSFSILNNVGYYSVTTIGLTLGLGFALQGIEYAWNAKLLGSKFLYYFTPIGHADDFSGKASTLIGFGNAKGPLKHVIDNVPYEEFWLLNKGKTYLLPAFIKTTQVSTPISTDVNEQQTQRVLVLVDTPINAVEYRDRENLIQWQRETRNLSETAAAHSLIQEDSETFEARLTNEVEGITQYNMPEFLRVHGIPEYSKLNQLSYIFDSGTNTSSIQIDYTSRLSKTPDTSLSLEFSVLEEDFPVLARTLKKNSKQDPFPAGNTAHLFSSDLLVEYFREMGQANNIRATRCGFKNPSNHVVNNIKETCRILSSIEENTDLSQLITRLNDRLDYEQNALNQQTDVAQAATVGMTTLFAAAAGIAHVAPDILTHMDSIQLLTIALANPEIGAEIANVLMAAGHPIPDFLQQYAVIPNPQDLGPVENLTREPSMILPQTMESFNYKYVGVAILAAGALGLGFWYLKNTGDSSVLHAASSASSSFESELLKGL